MINKVILVGNLGKDPEVTRLENGSVLAKFSVATNKNFRDKNQEWQTKTEWHNVVVWRFLAERAEKYLKKGSLVYIEGELAHRSYQDKDGSTKYITEIVGQIMKSLSRDFDGESAPRAATSPVSDSNFTPNKPNQDKDANSTDKDDLPF